VAEGNYCVAPPRAPVFKSPGPGLFRAIGLLGSGRGSSAGVEPGASAGGCTAAPPLPSPTTDVGASRGLPPRQVSVLGGRTPVPGPTQN
jgi:hypothetical protein